MLILLLGGASSGKSAAAEALASRLPAPVTYIATLLANDGDDDLMQRIESHRRRRPASWPTIDASADLPDELCTTAGTVLLDGLGAWVARCEPGPDLIGRLVDALKARSDDTVVVSDEVGMSVHPATESGRAFRDGIGAVNQRLAEVADHTLLVVAGRALTTAPIDIDALISGNA